MTTAVESEMSETGVETAILGGGCFWCLEAVFKQIKGVKTVTSGYCGGDVTEPCYQQVCSGETGHAEVVKVVFDSVLVSYRLLLEVFFTIHDPTTLNRQGNDIGTQYRSVIFALNEKQKQIALALVDELSSESIFSSPIVTKVEERSFPFWPAESEHQDYFFLHADQPYCHYVISPKLKKFRERFSRLFLSYR